MSRRIDELRDALKAAIDMSRDRPGLVQPADILHVVSCNLWAALDELEDFEKRLAAMESKCNA